MAPRESNCTIRSALDELLVRREGGRLAGGLGPQAQARVKPASRAWPSPAARTASTATSGCESAPPPARARATTVPSVAQRFGPGTGCCPPGDSRRRRPRARPVSRPGPESRRRRDGRSRGPPGATTRSSPTSTAPLPPGPYARGPASPNRPPCGPRCPSEGSPVWFSIRPRTTRCWLSCDRYGQHVSRGADAEQRDHNPQGEREFLRPRRPSENASRSARSCDRPALRARPPNSVTAGNGHRAAGQREKIACLTARATAAGGPCRARLDLERRQLCTRRSSCSPPAALPPASRTARSRGCRYRSVVEVAEAHRLLRLM